jgi:hypothetical protein
MTADDPFKLPGWTLGQALAWMIYQAPEAISQANGKDVFDVADGAIRRDDVDGDTLSADLRKRDELYERLKAGTLTAYGIRFGQTEHSSIPTASWHTIDSFYVPDAPSGISPDDVSSSRESSPRFRNVFVRPEDVLRLWPPAAQPLDFEQPETSAKEKDGDVPADVLASSTAAKARSASEGNIGGLSETGRALAKSYFDEPRWPLDHALNWIACRKIEALTLRPEELRSLLFRTVMYNRTAAALSARTRLMSF